MITLITPTIGRSTLSELAGCINRQTVPAEWLTMYDEHREGPAVLRNRLVEQATTEWVNPVDDDDLLDADYIETILPHLDAKADIVWTWCRVEAADVPPTRWQLPFNRHTLKWQNTIPNCAAVRRDLWLELQQRDVKNEDWDMWRRALAAGARFRCVEQVKWTYRQGNWDHRSPDEAWTRRGWQ